MGERINLHNLLVSLIKNNNVYYQPPESLKMSYPAIRYTKTNIDKVSADNSAYLLHDRYEIIIIDKLPDNPAVKALLAMPLCGNHRHYVADGLNHDVLILYY